MTKAEIRQKLEELQRAVDALPDEPKADEAWPEVGDVMWYVTKFGGVDSVLASPRDGVAMGLIDAGNAFRTREEAEREARITATWRKLRKASRESMAKKSSNGPSCGLYVSKAGDSIIALPAGYSIPNGAFLFCKPSDASAAIASIGEAAIIELLTDGRAA